MNTLFLIVVGILLINILGAIVTVFRERRDIAATWAWLLVLILLPVIGFIIYLFFGKKMSRSRVTDIQTQQRMGIEKKVTEQKALLEENELLPANIVTQEARALVNMFLLTDNAILTKANDITIYNYGLQKFRALFEDIRTANDHIHLEYYTFADDQLGNALRRLLEKKAAQGVKVRVIYDAYGSKGLPRLFFRQLEQLGGKVQPGFSSRFTFMNLRTNYRDHRKIAVIDGNIGYIGGFNIEDKYLGQSRKFGEWRDTHLRIRGDGVLSLQSRFFMDWNAAVKQEKVYYKAAYFPRNTVHGTTSMQVVASGPDSHLEKIKLGFSRAINLAKHSIWIETPYFIPDDSILDALKTAIASGVDVKIIVPAKMVHPFTKRATEFFLNLIIKAGGQVYFYQPGFLHSKTIIIDESITSIGTANFDIRSFKLNFEVNAFLYDHHIASQFKAIFNTDLAHSRAFTQKDIDKQTRWRTIRQELSRLFAPIL